MGAKDQKEPIAKAQFTPMTDNSAGPIQVQFNPASFQYSVSNNLEKGKKGKKQFVTSVTGKLTLELIFDTTDTGGDVREKTKKIARLMEARGTGEKKDPTVVKFEWGNFKFQGVIESFTETLDFFAPEGVPLRSSVSLSMVEQDVVFPEGSAGDAPPANQNATDLSNTSPADAAAKSGAPNAAKDIAKSNNQESLRFPSGQLTVDPSIQLGAAADFSAGAAIGASLGVDAGIGVSAGIGGGISAGASAGFGVSAGVSAGASAGFAAGAGASAGVTAGAGAGFAAGASAGIGVAAGASGGLSTTAGTGLSASLCAGVSAGAGFSAGAQATAGAVSSAGVSASGGAFAGLNIKPPRQSTSRIVVTRLVAHSESVGLTTDSGSEFQVGGRATVRGSAGLSADVGANKSLTSRIEFEEKS